jgi:hypothetical protein
MNKLPSEKRIQILTLLVEGMSLRAAGRATDTAFNTVAKLFVDAGNACADYQDRTLRNLTDEVRCHTFRTSVFLLICWRSVELRQKEISHLLQLFVLIGVDVGRKSANLIVRHAKNSTSSGMPRRCFKTSVTATSIRDWDEPGFWHIAKGKMSSTTSELR